MPVAAGRVDRLERRRREAALSAGTDYARYRMDPVGFARDVLGIEPTPEQAEIAEAVLKPPCRVLVKAGHNVGKSFLVAWLVIWWYFTRPVSTALTTSGGNLNAVKDIVWTEVRLLMARAGLVGNFIGPTAPEMRTSPDHWAKGMTAATGEGFQGRHRAHAMFAFDEAEGVRKVYWDTTGTMFQPDGSNVWVVILNPTTTTSESYQQEQATDLDGNPKWKVFTLSCLEHPNVKAALAGLPVPVPDAVSIAQVWGWLADSFEEVTAAERDEDTDVEFPPGSGRWWRPDPDGESRVLGRRPTAGTFGVWSERLWDRACANELAEPFDLPELGADIARHGNDRTEIHARCGPCSLAHEDHGGWDTVRTADRLMERATELAAWQTARRPPQAAPTDPKAIPIKVDDTGVGGGVTDILRSNGFNVAAVNAGEKAPTEDKYPLVRDELWFTVRTRARNGALDLSRLGKKLQARLKRQALAPTWKPTTDQRRSVEPKKDTKKRIGRSPDGMDALNLAYYPAAANCVSTWAAGPDRQNWRDRAGRR